MQQLANQVRSLVSFLVLRTALTEKIKARTAHYGICP